MNNLRKEVEKITTTVTENVTEDYMFDIERCKHLYNQIQKLESSKRKALRQYLEKLLRRMDMLEASDIDIGGAGTKGMVWYRVQGKKTPSQEYGKIDLEKMDVIILNLLEDNQAKKFFEDRSLDFSFILEGEKGNQRRLRATMYFDLGYVALNMRRIPPRIRPLDSYDFSDDIIKSFSIEHTKQGLSLITGITGAGKSTTLDAIVNYNNKLSNCHITIIGDPIERVHSSKRAIVRHREVGADVNSFRDGAIQALRQDPDMVIVGEMRSPETIMRTLELADTGHKVFTTLHTSSAIETIDRILDAVPEEAQSQVKARLADVLKVIVSQKLVPSTSGELILAKEILHMNSAIRAAIKNDNTQEIYGMIRQGSKEGMMTIEQDLKRLYRKNKVSFDNAIANANNKKRFKNIVKYSF